MSKFSADSDSIVVSGGIIGSLWNGWQGLSYPVEHLDGKLLLLTPRGELRAAESLGSSDGAANHNSALSFTS